MSVTNIDGDGTHVDDLDPGLLTTFVVQRAADVEKRARELIHAEIGQKHEAARRLAETVSEYLALCDRHARVPWNEWRRVEELRSLAGQMRKIGETADADRYEARATQLADDVLSASRPPRTTGEIG